MFDAARVPEAVRDRLAVIGYWACSRDLRDRVDSWDNLDDSDQAVAGNDLELIGSALER